MYKHLEPENYMFSLQWIGEYGSVEHSLITCSCE